MLYSMVVIKGSRNIQKTRLYAFLIKESGCIKPWLIMDSLPDFSLIHANRMDVCVSITIQ